METTKKQYRVIDVISYICGWTLLAVMAYLLLSTLIGAVANGKESINYDKTTLQAIEVLSGLEGEMLPEAQEDLARLQALYDSAVTRVDSIVQMACQQKVVVAQLKYKDTPDHMTEEKLRLHQVAETTRSQCPDLFIRNQS